MLTETENPKRGRLSHEILGLLGITFAVSLFLYVFLSLSAQHMVDKFLNDGLLDLDLFALTELEYWIKNLSLVVAVCFFITLFLFLLGQKLSYINSLTRGVEALRTHRLDYDLPLEGDNELTGLAESINYLSATERQLRAREQQMQEEKEQLIRALSHDIRTPLTAILSYSQFLNEHPDCSPAQRQEYLVTMQRKAEQIRELTAILLDGARREPERFEQARLLMEQLAEQAEELLEEEFQVLVELEDCPPFQGSFDVGELQRIFDNLVSNVEKYAHPGRPVIFRIFMEHGALVIAQSNYKRILTEKVESHRVGLSSIRRIAHNYGGSVEVQETVEIFSIAIALREF